jgi:uncharacterized protein (DUF927 family)
MQIAYPPASAGPSKRRITDRASWHRRAWLERLTERTEGLSRTLRERMDSLELQFVPELVSGQVQRVGRHFALIAAAGEIVTEAGITGWPEGEAVNAARRCFNACTALVEVAQ